MIQTIEKEGWDKEEFLGNFEKDLIEASTNNKEISISEVHIDRSTGLISATVKNAKGKEQAMKGIELLTKLHDSSSQTASLRHGSSFLPGWLCWLLGCDDNETTTVGPPVEDDMTPDQKRDLDNRRAIQGLPPLFAGQY
ncbi:MAG: hypothetical protein R3E32_21135 [Chitinophagales bacterium]